jgi:hypothetical protein
VKKDCFLYDRSHQIYENKGALFQIREKRTGFCRAMTRILPQMQLTCAFLPWKGQTGSLKAQKPRHVLQN